MGFPTQEYWRMLLFLSLDDLPDSGIEHVSPTLADRLPLSYQQSSVICIKQLVIQACSSEKRSKDNNFTGWNNLRYVHRHDLSKSKLWSPPTFEVRELSQ